jgi:hypothetical protein
VKREDTFFSRPSRRARLAQSRRFAGGLGGRLIHPRRQQANDAWDLGKENFQKLLGEGHPWV